MPALNSLGLEMLLGKKKVSQKMRYHAKSRTFIYRSKMHRVLKRNFEVFPVLDWIAAVTAHIPNQGEPLARQNGRQAPFTKPLGFRSPKLAEY